MVGSLFITVISLWVCAADSPAVYNFMLIGLGIVITSNITSETISPSPQNCSCPSFYPGGYLSHFPPGLLHNLQDYRGIIPPAFWPPPRQGLLPLLDLPSVLIWIPSGFPSCTSAAWLSSKPLCPSPLCLSVNCRLPGKAGETFYCTKERPALTGGEHRRRRQAGGRSRGGRKHAGGRKWYAVTFDLWNTLLYERIDRADRLAGIWDPGQAGYSMRSPAGPIFRSAGIWSWAAGGGGLDMPQSWLAWCLGRAGWPYRAGGGTLLELYTSAGVGRRSWSWRGPWRPWPGWPGSIAWP